jgi:membrane-bound lytic murein transglycosylase MltF
MTTLRNLASWIACLLCFLAPSYLLAQTKSANSEVWTGTYEQMLQHGQIRVAVPYDRTIYVNDKGTPRGLAVEMAKGFQTWLNQQYAAQLKGKSISVKLIPTNAADLFTSLSTGKSDMVIGDLGLYEPLPNAHQYILSHAVKMEREVLIAGPSSIAITSPEDLSGQTVYGGRNTNFPATLAELNKNLERERKPLVKLVSPVGTLDGEDLLEMVDSGLIPFVIMSDWRAQLWQPIYKKMVIHEDIFSKDSGWIGWGVRSSNQDLNDVITNFSNSNGYDAALKSYRTQEYKEHIQGLKDPIEKSAWARFESMRPLFVKYGAQYNLDPLFIAALGFQETLLNQNAESKVGAIGVMQLMPATGSSLGVGDIHLLEPNIHAGADYMNQLITKYFPDAQFRGDNRALFAIASYNIGPNNVAKARDQAKSMGFDPNEWFKNVEFIATERMGYEPMIYVRNVYKYFISYELKLGKIQGIQP